MSETLSRRRLLQTGAVTATTVAGLGATPNLPAHAVPATPTSRPPDWETLFAQLAARRPDNTTLNLVWHGHSVVAGYHLTPEVRTFESYPHLVHRGLAGRYPTAVLNNVITAIGGENSVTGARRFTADVLGHDPHLVFIDYAINDRRLPLGEVEDAWRRMIERALDHPVPLILNTPTGTRFDDLTDPTNVLSIRAQLVRDLGAEYQLPVADLSAAWNAELARGTDQETLLAQGLHPNLAGHTIAGTAILALIDQLADVHGG